MIPCHHHTAAFALFPSLVTPQTTPSPSLSTKDRSGDLQFFMARGFFRGDSIRDLRIYWRSQF